MKKILFFVILAAMALSACAPEAVPQFAKCNSVVKIPVYDVDGKLVASYTSTFASHYVNNNQGAYVLTVDDINAWHAFYDPIAASIDKANEGFSKLFADDDLINGPRLQKDQYEGQIVYSNDPYSCPITDNDPYWGQSREIRLNLRGCSADDMKEYYCTNVDFTSQKVYVTVTTPAGSKADYSFPKAWLNQIIWSSFTDKVKPFEFNPSFERPDVALDPKDYSQSLVNTLVGNNNQEEVAAFTLVDSDFEGRHELEPVIARAIEIGAVEAGRPVVMTVKGMMSSGDYAVANISAHQDSIHIDGWMALTFGGISGGGGGGELHGSYSSRFEDITRGSIYVVNP